MNHPAFFVDKQGTSSCEEGDSSRVEMSVASCAAVLSKSDHTRCFFGWSEPAGAP